MGIELEATGEEPTYTTPAHTGVPSATGDSFPLAPVVAAIIVASVIAALYQRFSAARMSALPSIPTRIGISILEAPSSRGAVLLYQELTIGTQNSQRLHSPR
jgi:hypothetical protein